jgi:nucleoside-diphosphate-sugar epimerase
MKIFVTGSSGFVGSHLVPILKKLHTIHCMSSDLLDFDAVKKEVQYVNPDIIVHLAARTEVEKSFYEQVSFSQVNYIGSVNLIESAKQCSNLKNFVFASTMEVYGWQPISDEVAEHGVPNQSVAFDEFTLPNPNAPYAVAKYAVEKYLEYMHRSQGFPFTAIRQTNSYGRKDNDFFVTEQIIAQMLKSDIINLGYAEPYRNFLFIDDLLDAWTTVITNPDVCQGKIFTLGPDNPIKIQDYADMIAGKLNWVGTINWNTKPLRHGEIYWLNSNHNLITNTLDWRPRVALSEGLDRTIDIWRNIIDNKI